MADKFNGFSQDEINKVSGVRTNKKHGAEAVKQGLRNQPTTTMGIRRMPEKAFKQAEQLRKQQQVASKPTNTNNDAAKNGNKNINVEKTPVDQDDTINPDSSMSKSLEDALFFAPLKMQTNGQASTTPAVPTNAAVTADSTSNDDSSILKVSTLSHNNNSSDDTSILPTIPTSSTDDLQLNTDSPFKGVSLKDFEIHRKMIQEQNKQKKELLYKAIEQHTQKTAAETRKIEEIRHELSKLESDLAVDVALLRKQIDNACIHFATVEKQYIKIEAQFLKAKIDLHNAAEKKELLTEHLCTVIAHNEDRKAQKLSELMQKVGLAPNDDYIEPAIAENDA